MCYKNDKHVVDYKKKTRQFILKVTKMSFYALRRCLQVFFSTEIFKFNILANVNDHCKRVVLKKKQKLKIVETADSDEKESFFCLLRGRLNPYE